MNNLLKEAIADAKAVRETALANAKIALEEAFTPRLQSMLSAKLSEEEGMEDEMAMEDEMPMDEPVAAEPEMEAPVEEPAPEMEEEMADDEMAEEGMRGEETDEGMREDDEDPTDMHSEAEDAELEEILRELEGEDEEAVTEGEDEETVEEQSGSTGIGKGTGMKQASSSDEEDPGKGKLKENEGDDKEEVTEEEEVDLDEIINALREEEGDEAEPVEENDTAGVDDGDAAKDLEEAYKVIRFMKSKLNEVNLLNAKLLFSNKLFRNHSLNESQKMKVIENFDRAQTLREVKLVFATLTESFKLGGKRKVKTIKESYASKPSRSTRPSKKVLSEGNDVANRFKKLAGLL